MTLPNFLIIGAAKCATTSLASLLDQHPQAAIVKGKEPHFFSYNDHYKLGLETYQQGFKHCSNAVAIGDASTSYSRLRQHPLVIERIKTHLGSPKIIYMVRHPIERIESAYIEQMTEPHNKHIQSINQAVQEHPMMIDSSRYWEVYRAYRSAFGKGNVHIIFFEEYKNNLRKTYSDVCKYLEIDTLFIPNYKNENVNARAFAKTKISNDTILNTQWNKTLLKEIKNALKNDNQKFLAYFRKNSNYWR